MSISISDGQNIRKVSLSINKKRFFHLFPKVPLRCLLFSVGPPNFRAQNFASLMWAHARAHGHKIKKRTCALSKSCADARAWSRSVNPASKFIRWYFESICWFNYNLKRLVLDQCIDLKNCYIQKLFNSQDAFGEFASYGSHDLFLKLLHLKNYELTVVWILSFETK